MAWSIKCHAASGMIELVFAGNVTGPEMREATSWSIALMKKQDIKNILVNTIDQGKVLSTMDIYNLPGQYEKEGLTRQSRVAFLPSHESAVKEQAQFYANVCVNRGWMVRLFENREDAMQWLTDGEKTAVCVTP